MKVTLRKRNQGGKTSLYLDYYHKGKRKKEYLKLYLDPDPKTNYDRLCEIEIPIPHIDEQRKYVRLYKGLLNNQKTYENSLDDLHLICNSYMDTLKNKFSEPIGGLVELVDNRNTDGANTNLLGINVNKVFMPSKAKTTEF